MSDVRIRPYELRDRQAIRQLACDTADRGEPVERFFPDRELAAELLTRYYTDDEPGSTWVAEADGRVVGYLTGCLDTRRYRRAMACRIVPGAVTRAIRRDTLCAPQTWRLLFAAICTAIRGGFRRCVPLDRFAAHLHVNLDGTFRGQQLGVQLVERFVHQARVAGARGIHISVRGDNLRACRLFERLGFLEWRRCPVIMPRLGRFVLHHTIVYAKPL